MTSKQCPMRYSELLTEEAVPAHTAGLTETTDTTITASLTKVAPAHTAGLQWDHPLVIYQRYTTKRESWYQSQPAKRRTDQQYRKACGLPRRYKKADYSWCQDWKIMGNKYKEGPPSVWRDWTKEEMTAYLDWSKAEDDRVEALVIEEVASRGNPFHAERGTRHIWEAAAIDNAQQQQLYEQGRLEGQGQLP